MLLNLDNIRVLDAIERTGSFAAAAKALNRVPSAVTYAIQQLESDLGVSLFDRSGYRAHLTPVGQEFLKEGRLLLEQTIAIEKKIKVSAGLAPSHLSLAYDEALGFDGINKVLQIFFAAYPETSLEISAEVLNGTKDALLSGSRDLVIGWFPDLPTEPLYRYKVIGHTPFVFAVAPNHPLAQVQHPLSVKEISAYRIVFVPDSAKVSPKTSSGYAPERQYISAPSMDVKLKAQLAGLGVGFLPLLLAKPYLKQGLLIEKEVDRPKIDSRCYVAWREDKMTPILSKLIDIIQDNRKLIAL